MLSIEDMRKLRDAYFPHLPSSEDEILAELGNPSREEIVDTALAGMQSEDRNIRVLMLRVLKYHPGDRAMEGILRGLKDKKRRAKSVALDGCRSFLHYPEITSRLEAMVNDESEHRKIRRGALGCLASLGATDFMKDTLSKHENIREGVLLNLLTLDLSDKAECRC